MGDDEDTSCPFPLVIPHRPENAIYNGCALPCQNIIYTQSEWDDVNIALQVCGSISLFGSLFTLLSWIMSRRKRREQFRILHFSLCTAVIALLTLVPSMVGKHHVFCEDNSQASSDGFCVVQGFLLMWVGLASGFWWFFIAVGVYSGMLGTRKFQLWAEWPRLQYTISYGFPLLCATIAASTGHISYSYNSLWCFVDGGDDGAWEYALFYVPMGTLVVLGCVFLLRVLLFVSEHIRKANGERTSVSAATYRSTLFRLLLFLMCYLVSFTLMVFFREFARAKESAYTRAVEDWVVCLLFAERDQCATVPDERYPYDMMIAASCLTSGLGITVWAIYGNRLENYYLWRSLLLRALRLPDTYSATSMALRHSTSRSSVPSSTRLDRASSLSRESGGGVVATADAAGAARLMKYMRKLEEEEEQGNMMLGGGGGGGSGGGSYPVTNPAVAATSSPYGDDRL